MVARILLVDDYEDALHVWAQYLRLSGFQVTACCNGSDALDAVDQDRPDIAVLDLELPGLSGLDLARQLRARADTIDLPLIAMTGHSGPEAIVNARQAGFDLVMVKPCDPGQLNREIARLLAGRLEG